MLLTFLHISLILEFLWRWSTILRMITLGKYGRREGEDGLIINRWPVHYTSWAFAVWIAGQRTKFLTIIDTNNGVERHDTVVMACSASHPHVGNGGGLFTIESDYNTLLQRFTVQPAFTSGSLIQFLTAKSRQRLLTTRQQCSYGNHGRSQDWSNVWEPIWPFCLRNKNCKSVGREHQFTHLSI